ncbi:hypothetical protein cypCar_00003864 [Cyprinus carpio]|nr:hypothetical protein cypCar_00003864 [Cyprinus carpio]
MHLSRADHRFLPCSSMMALWQAIALLVICGLIECNDGVCRVTCTTDFISMLNCSNSDSAGAASCHVVADCRDEYFAVNGSCTIKSPQSWCTMEPDDLDFIMAFDTNCSIIVTQMTKQGNMEIPTKSHSETIVLYKSGTGGFKKLSLWQRIPSPHEYFTPLYHTYQGDFKKWVGPVLTFNSFDVLEKSTTLQVLCEKQLNESSEEPANSRTGERDFGPAGQNSSKLYFLGSNSQSNSHSGGHISMDTVTVSGQEGVVADWSSDRHRRSLEDFLNEKDANQRAAEIDARQPLILDGRRSLQGSDCDDWHLQEHDLENIEQVSLDSYGSNEQSDDGYPQMGLDLDTIDSGFLESDCSSPSAFDGNEQIDTSSLDGVGRSHSNYVKQWVAFTSVQVDAHSTGK